MNSTELRGFLTGLILGDGTIDRGVENRAFRFKSINEEFIFYIRDYLINNTNFNVKIVEHDPTHINGVYRKGYFGLTIKSHPYFAKRYHQFYDDFRNRRITSKAISWLNPAGLANWYMSDGYVVRVGSKSGKIKDRRVELATDRYQKEDIEKVKTYLETTYGYKITLAKRRENVYRIRFSLESAQEFFMLIHEYVVPTMYYKLDLCYDYQPKWMSSEYYELMNSFHSASDPTE